METRMKKVKTYAIGISLTGLLLYILQLLPNILWKFAPPANNVLAQNASASQVLNFIEGFLGMMTVVLLVFLVRKGVERNSNVYVVLAILFLAGYYISWILYYNGVVDPWLLIAGLAAMPPLYFFFSGVGGGYLREDRGNGGYGRHIPLYCAARNRKKR